MCVTENPSKEYDERYKNSSLLIRRLKNKIENPPVRINRKNQITRLAQLQKNQVETVANWQQNEKQRLGQ
jgi:hypothetical protein